MEKTVEALSVKVESLEKVETENVVLQGENERLVSLLQEKSDQVNRLMAQLSSVDLDGKGPPDGVGRALQPDKTLELLEGSGKADKHLLDLRKELQEKVEHLTTIVRNYSIDPSTDPEGLKLPEGVKRQLEVLVRDSICLFIKTVKAKTSKISEKLAKDIEKFRQVHCPVAKKQFKACLEKVQLARGQQDELISLRGDLLGKLKELYNERNKLNMKAMSLMLPHPNAAGKYVDTSPEGKIECISQVGYVGIPTDLEFTKVLDEIKDTLRREFSLLAHANYHLVTKLLTPVQASLAIITVFPIPLDMLGVANTIAA